MYIYIYLIIYQYIYIYHYSCIIFQPGGYESWDMISVVKSVFFEGMDHYSPKHRLLRLIYLIQVGWLPSGKQKTNEF